PGMDDVPSAILIPEVAREVDIPVIAAGGFSDGRSLVYALALGADAILLGTRFMASVESPMHENFKQWMVGAKETDTVVVERSIRNAARIIQNEAARTVERMEAEGATLAELLPVIAGRIGRDAYLSGDIDAATIACGQAVGLIREIKPVGDIIADIMSEAESTLARLNQAFGA
ncbi:MAG: nitronate monooxygenase, partial [Nitrospiraceae bacterium]|nr:nitronate monooxygenase [Nitrospiraceae bacterium]